MNKLRVGVWILIAVVLFGAAVDYRSAQAVEAVQRGSEGGKKQFEYSNRPLNKREQRWIAEQLAKTPLEEKIGQMVMATLTARFMNLESADFARVRELVLEQRVGGFALHYSNIYEAAVLLNRLQELARIPLLVAADFETGTGMRLADATFFPWNMGIGATGDPKFAYLQGEATAVEARGVGINMVFAPVADVNNNPGNPVINVRSYGEDPGEVSKYVSAFVQGAQKQGVIATAKHFPGHGDTSIDSHIGLPVIDVNRERLESVELQPFRAAIASGVGAIMSAHVALPRIDPAPAPSLRPPAPLSSAEASRAATGPVAGTTVPSTLSTPILTGILRNELKFDGLVVTDSMQMAGITARYPPGDSAVLAVKAGADILLGPEDSALTVRAISQAVARGEIATQRIEQSFERILLAKVRLGLLTDRFVEVYDIDSTVSAPKLVAAAEGAAARALTLLRNNQSLIPMSAEKSARALHISVSSEFLASDERTVLGAVLVSGLKQRVPQTDAVVIDRTATSVDAQKVLAQLNSYRAIVVSLFIRPRSGRGSIAVPAVARETLNEIIRRGTKVMVVSFGSPYLIEEIPDAPGYLCAYGDYGPGNLEQRVVAKALFGEIGISGKLPVTIPGLFPRGSGIVVPNPEAKAGKPGLD